MEARTEIIQNCSGCRALFNDWQNLAYPVPPLEKVAYVLPCVLCALCCFLVAALAFLWQGGVGLHLGVFPCSSVLGGQWQRGQDCSLRSYRWCWHQVLV